jgi:type I restriction enzyme, S subunit
MDNWVTEDLGDILTLNYGWSLPDKKRVPGNVPVYGSNGVVGSHNKSLVDSPGIIVGRKGSAGNVHFSHKPFCPIDTTFFIAPTDTHLDIKFLYYLLLFIDLKRILGDVGVPGLNREMAYKEKARFPKGRDEQRKIAYILETVQRAIDQQERITQVTTEMKKALMQKLFTKGLRGEPQKQTEIGSIPKSWEVKKLGNLVNLQTGKLNSNASKLNGQFPFFTCSQETFSIDHYAYDTEAILLSGNNAQGIYSVKYYKGKFNAYQRTYIITIKKEKSIPYSFLLHALSRNLERLRTLSIGTSTKYLTLGVIQNLLIPVPQYEEAENIGDQIKVIEGKLENLDRKKKNLESLFHSLLYLFMTAKIRVQDFDLNYFIGGEVDL